MQWTLKLRHNPNKWCFALAGSTHKYEAEQHVGEARVEVRGTATLWSGRRAQYLPHRPAHAARRLPAARQ